MKISVGKLHDNDRHDDIPDTPEERLDLVEKLRHQAGKFLYDEYPARLKRIVAVERMKGSKDA